jgi:hypothetical protein
MSTIRDAFLWFLLIGVPLILFIGGYFAAPVLLVWSWVRWMRQPRQWTPWAILSLAGLGFVTASAMFAISALVYSRSIGGDFPHHFNDPLFMKIFRWGGLLSRIGTVLGIGGLWRPGALRWHVVLCGVGILMFWMVTAGD